MYPPVQGPNDPIATPIATLLRKPLPAQALTISGLAKALNTSRSVRIVGECGTGKTLMSMGVAHADGTPYSAIAMCPHTWCSSGRGKCSSQCRVPVLS
jgi:MoxR-like ATPase